MTGIGGTMPVTTVDTAVLTAIHIIVPVFFAISSGLIVTAIARRLVKCTRRVQAGA
jgi:hypothetical protein